MRCAVFHPCTRDQDQPLEYRRLSQNRLIYGEAASARGSTLVAPNHLWRVPGVPEPLRCLPSRAPTCQVPFPTARASGSSPGITHVPGQDLPRGRTCAIEHVRTVSDRACRGTTRPSPAEGDRARGVTSQLRGGIRADRQRGRLLRTPGGTRTPSLTAGNPAPEPLGDRDRDSVGTGSARGAAGSGSQAEQAAGRVCCSVGGFSWVIRQGA